MKMAISVANQALLLKAILMYISTILLHWTFQKGHVFNHVHNIIMVLWHLSIALQLHLSQVVLIQLLFAKMALIISLVTPRRVTLLGMTQ